MPEYTVLAGASVVVAVAIDLWVARSRLLLTARYWATMAIVLGFMVLVDGWLTRLDAPVVTYAASATSGVRFPWDIPVEDFGFGFSMCTLVLVLWVSETRWPRSKRSLSRADALQLGTPPPGYGTPDDRH